MRLGIQIFGVHRNSEKDVITSLVMRIFSGFLGASKICDIIVFSISRFGYYLEYSKAVKVPSLLYATTIEPLLTGWE